MKEENKKLKTYLYITSFNNDKEKKDAFIAVTKAILYVEVAVEMENFGDYGILFTSFHDVNDINERIKKHGVYYLLIDITMDISMQTVVGMLPDFDLETLKSLQAGFGKKITKEERLNHLKFYREQAAKDQKFEVAAELRDKIKILEEEIENEKQ